MYTQTHLQTHHHPSRSISFLTYEHHRNMQCSMCGGHLDVHHPTLSDMCPVASVVILVNVSPNIRTDKNACQGMPRTSSRPLVMEARVWCKVMQLVPCPCRRHQILSCLCSTYPLMSHTYSTHNTVSRLCTVYQLMSRPSSIHQLASRLCSTSPLMYRCPPADIPPVQC